MKETYVAPCKDCEKRREHCHSKCKLYADWKAEQEKLKKWKAEQKELSYAKTRAAIDHVRTKKANKRRKK